MDRIREQLEKGLGELSPEELEELQDLILTEADGLAEAQTTPEVVATLNELADAGEQVTTEKTVRQEAADQAEADATAARERIAGIRPSEEEASEEPAAEGEDESKDDEKTEPEAGAEEEAPAEEPAEAVAATGTPEGTGRVRRMARRGSMPEVSPERTEAEVGRAVVTASGALRGVDPRKPLESKRELATAMCDTLKRMNRRGASTGDVLLATATWDYPEDRTFTNDPDHNADIVDAVIDQQAIVASGGICAPVNVDYAVNTWATAARPIKEGLASFQASRGGLRYVTPPDQSALAEATSVWTEATDAEPGESTKPVLHISCGEEQVVYVDAVPTRLGFGNMQGQFAPEWVAANTDLAIAAAARVAENNLLSRIKAVATEDVTFAKGLGASRDFVKNIAQITAAYRWIHRIDRGVKMTAIFPDWVKDIVRVDLALQVYNTSGDALNYQEISDDQVKAYFMAQGINPIFHLDGLAEPESKTFPLQGWAASAIKKETAVPVFPTKVEWFLFVEGSIQFLDGGRLDLGVVRDSTLDATNDYETFIETFEGIANRGFSGAVLELVSEVCANGTGPTPISYTTCA